MAQPLRQSSMASRHRAACSSSSGRCRWGRPFRGRYQHGGGRTNVRTHTIISMLVKADAICDQGNNQYVPSPELLYALGD